MRRGSGRLSVNVLGTEASVVSDVGGNVAGAEEKEDIVVRRRSGVPRVRCEVRRTRFEVEEDR